MHIAVVGAGYVGLVSAACFADFGHHVACFEHDPTRRTALLDGAIPIFEPGLDSLVAETMASGRLRFLPSLDAAMRHAEAVFIAVGTPADDSGDADLSYVFAAVDAIADQLDPDRFTVVVTKSTVPVGTGDAIEQRLRERRPDVDVAVAANPEFLREGAAIGDFKRPDRIILGTNDPRAYEVLAALYRPLYLHASPLVAMSRRSAELTKYAANGFLAAKITFINEIADLCAAVGADVNDVAHGMGLDNRIGSKFLHAGPGYGGSCFPKDVAALVHTARAANRPLHLIETVAAVNAERKRAMADYIVAAADGSVRGRRVGVLGLTFKPNTDDMREAAALTILPRLQAAGAQVIAFDPAGMANAAALLPDVQMAADAYACADGADILVLLTEWNRFRALDLRRLHTLMRGDVIVDLRNVYRPDEVRRCGFRYFSLGRS